MISKSPFALVLLLAFSGCTQVSLQNKGRYDYVIKQHRIKGSEPSFVDQLRASSQLKGLLDMPRPNYSAFKDPQGLESERLLFERSFESDTDYVDYSNARVNLIIPSDSRFITIPCRNYKVGDNWFKNMRIVKDCGFQILKTEVTNLEFLEFVTATGYVTDAERKGWSWVPNFYSKKFAWKRQDGASWRWPFGPDSVFYRSILNHPVTQVSPNDAHQYAKWKNCRLPYAVEWEIAVRVFHTLNGDRETIQRILKTFHKLYQAYLNGDTKNHPQLSLEDRAIYDRAVPRYVHGQPTSVLNSLNLEQFRNRVLTAEVKSSQNDFVYGLIDGVCEICEQYGLLDTESGTVAAPYVGRSWLDKMTPAYDRNGLRYFSQIENFLLRQRFLLKNEAYPHIGFRVCRDQQY